MRGHHKAAWSTHARNCSLSSFMICSVTAFSLSFISFRVSFLASLTHVLELADMTAVLKFGLASRLNGLASRINDVSPMFIKINNPSAFLPASLKVHLYDQLHPSATSRLRVWAKGL